jgi:phage terminase large subunit
VAIPEGFDWQKPDYTAVYKERMERLERIRQPGFDLEALKAHYRDNPADFIDDWGFTSDPRNAEIGLDVNVPFLLFKRQREYIVWLHDGWLDREDGLTEKSRDMGVSWLCVAFGVWMLLFHPGTVVGFGSRKETYVDAIGDPKSLFWKARAFLNALPAEFRPASLESPFMRILNNDNGASIIGEAGDNIGRGARTSIYFVDEAAFIEHADSVDAALSQASNCKQYVSTPNGAGNSFYRKRHGGKIPVFVFDWKQDPRKNEAWYQKQVDSLDPVIVAQEIDRNYEGSVSNAFIPAELVLVAMRRGPADVRAMGGLRVGVDVARFGDDKSVITFRRGRVMLKQTVVAKMDVTQVAGLVKSEISAYAEKPEQIAVDSIGIGAGVADILRGWYPDRVDKITFKRTQVVVDVNSSVRMGNGQDYNLRAFMWREMREWLKSASLPNDQDLKTDLTALRYLFKGGEMLMESKDDAKKRGVKSPDRGDSLAMTFAVPTIAPREIRSATVPAYSPSDAAMGM